MTKRSIGQRRIFILMTLLFAVPVVEFFLLYKEVGSFKKENGVLIDAIESICANSSKTRSICWQKIVEYNAIEGKKNTIVSEYFTYSKPQLGETVVVLVNPSDRYDARVGGTFGVWSGLIVHSMFVFGLLFIASLFLVFDVRREKIKLLRISNT